MRGYMEELENVLTDFIGEPVTYQGEDKHAVYFIGESGNEYKLRIDTEEEALYEREHGKEDWQIVF